MRLSFLLAYIALSLLVPPAARAGESHLKQAKQRSAEAKTHKSAKKRKLTIHVAPGGWGTADVRDIEELLHSVADELWTYYSRDTVPPILVMHSEKGPLVKYQRGADGQYVVTLSATDRRWAQYAYQFSHEFCHILSDSGHPRSKAAVQNQWFEETLCETAALFTLRQMAETWRTSPPYPQWKEYAPALDAYAEHFLSEAHRYLPPGTTLEGWYHEHETDLRRNPYLRQQNEVVANLLLPLFEENPDYWDALGYLNLDEREDAATLKEYLIAWYRNAPDSDKDFIRKTIAMFGLSDTLALADQSK